MRGFENEPSTEWDADTAQLVAWYNANRDRLPRDAFQLHHWARVLDPEKWFRMLDRDVAAGPAGIRSRFGAFRADLSRLRELFAQAEPSEQSPKRQRQLVS